MTEDIEQLRARAIALLRREDKPMQTGELAVALGVPTHRLHLALNGPLQLLQVNFCKEGWSIPAAERRPLDLEDMQNRLDG